MFSASLYAARRTALCAQMPGGIALFAANLPSPNNYANNTYYFRQDSSFLYYFGLDVPSLVGLIDLETGASTLYGDDPTIDDIIWTGPQPSFEEQALSVGVTKVAPLADLKPLLDRTIASGRRVHFLPPYRGESKRLLSTLLGIKYADLHPHLSADLLFAVASMREVKGAEEIAELEGAFEPGYQMHTLAMRMCRAGVIERQIAGAIEGVSKSMGRGVSFPPIVSQHGETLHNLHAEGVLTDGRLLLVDAGAEARSYYCSDHTRTYPVSGRFSAQQKEVYNIVLKAHDEVAKLVRPGMMYTEIHRQAYRILAEGLQSIGLVKNAETAVESGAMTMLMPHGLGHGMGLDVHDCEAFGERSFDFSAFLERAEATATCIHRATWRLRPGTVLTDEPGLYFIPALIDKCRAEGKYKGVVNYEALDAYRDFGGIRIEDDLLVTRDGARMFGGAKHIPITVAELEAAVGQ